MTTQPEAEQRISGLQPPSDENIESRLMITEHPAIDPDYPVYFQMDSPAMKNFGLLSGDILVVDRALIPMNDAIVVAFVNGCFYCRRYVVINNRPVLMGDEDEEATPGGEILQICGVVTSVCRHTVPAVLRSGNFRRICTL